MHVATEELLSHFEYGHLPPHMARVSARFHTLACELVEEVGEGREMTVALRKLLEAKDCAVRQARLNAEGTGDG